MELILKKTFLLSSLVLFVYCDVSLIQNGATESSRTTTPAPPTDSTSFSCEGRPSGYYADIEAGCQVYHMCDGLGRQFSYACPNTTLFQQRMLICDHWYMVNCSQSETDYSANLLIGQRDKPFVDDNTVHKRTPRPDIFGVAPQYDQVRGRKYDQLNQERNLIGGDFIKHTDSSNRKDVKYFVPSHWSTELSQQSITENPRKVQKFATKDNVKVATQFRRVSTTSAPTAAAAIETTAADSFLEAPSKYFLPPYDINRYPVLRNSPNNDILQQTALTLQSLKVNITSTTQLSVSDEDSSTESSFKINNLSQESEEITIKPPSKDLEPPKYDEKTIDPRQSNKIVLDKELQPPKFYGEITKKLNRTVYDDGKIRDLRKVLFIPDYSFPLDPLPRPSYDSFSSYQVKATGEINNNETSIEQSSTGATPKTDCPDRCDPDMLIAGTCQPCILVKR